MFVVEIDATIVESVLNIVVEALVKLAFNMLALVMTCSLTLLIALALPRVEVSSGLVVLLLIAMLPETPTVVPGLLAIPRGLLYTEMLLLDVELLVVVLKLLLVALKAIVLELIRSRLALLTVLVLMLVLVVFERVEV